MDAATLAGAKNSRVGGSLVVARYRSRYQVYDQASPKDAPLKPLIHRVAML